MEAIRGVNCDYAVQKLLEKELIVILGRNEKLPGHPLVYGTSRSFMDYFGINSPEDLPKIKEVISTDIIDPTAVQSDTLHVAGEEEQLLNSTETLVVTEDGELLEQPVAEETIEETATTETNEEEIAEEVIIDEVEVVEEETADEETEEVELTEEDTETAQEQAEEEESNDEQSNNEEETKP